MRALEATGRAPIVYLATESSISSEIEKLSDKTGSCLMGPFSFSRLLTEIQTRLERRRTLGSALRVDNLEVSSIDRDIDESGVDVALAHGRFRLL